MSKPIGFVFSNIVTEQFATIEENYTEGKEINISTRLRLGKHDDDKEVAVFTLFKFEIEKQPFIIIETGCRFKIEQSAWNSFIHEDKMIIPQGFIIHLAMLAIGTVRGILHAKTEGTIFNRFVLPTIDVTGLVKEDFVFE